MSEKNKAGYHVPKLRFPEFREAGEWDEKTLGDFLTESRIPGNKGDVAKKLTVKLWGNGVFAKNETTRGSVNTQYFRRKAGQFIYSKLDFLNQAFGVIPAALDNYESTVDLPCFDFLEGIDSGFLLEYVKRKDFYEKNGEEADGSRKAKRIQVEAFLTFPILVPELVEQQKIADCLASLDELITLEAQKLDTLKAHKKGLMQQLFPAEGETLPQRRFPEFRDVGEWEEKILGDIAKITSGGTPNRAEPDYWSGSIPWITTSLIDFNTIDYAEEFITAEGLKNSSAKLIPAQTLLMAMYGQGKTRGKVALLGLEATTNQACAAIMLNKEVDTNFAFQNLACRYDEIRKLSNEGGQENLSAGLIKEISLTYPGLQEQQKISDCLASLDDLITAQTHKLAALKTHKKGLMQQLFPALDAEVWP